MLFRFANEHFKFRGKCLTKDLPKWGQPILFSYWSLIAKQKALKEDNLSRNYPECFFSSNVILYSMNKLLTSSI